MIDVDLITGIKENNIYTLKEFRSYWDSLCCNKSPSDNRTIFTVLFNNIAMEVFDNHLWRMYYQKLDHKRSGKSYKIKYTDEIYCMLTTINVDLPCKYYK